MEEWSLNINEKNSRERKKVWEHIGLTFTSIIPLVCTRYYVPRQVYFFYFSFYVQTIHTCTHNSHTNAYINKHTYIKYIHTCIFHISCASAQGKPYKPRSHRRACVARCGGQTHNLWVFDSTVSNWVASALMQRVLGGRTKSCLRGACHGYIDKPVNRHYLTGTKPVNLNWALVQVISQHDDFIKWKHFLRYWPFVPGIHRSPVNSPHKGQWRGPLMFCLFCAWINGWVNNGEAGDLRRHRAHYFHIRYAQAQGSDLTDKFVFPDAGGKLTV